MSCFWRIGSAAPRRPRHCPSHRASSPGRPRNARILHSSSRSTASRGLSSTPCPSTCSPSIRHHGHDQYVIGRDGQTRPGHDRALQHFPQPGWVSHDPARSSSREERGSARSCRRPGRRHRRHRHHQPARNHTGMGPTTRRSIDLAIVWQCRRTGPTSATLSPMCRTCPRKRAPSSMHTSARPRSAGSSTTSMVRACAQRTETSRSGPLFLVSELTAGRVHAIDVTNASRTLLMDLGRGEWDPELLNVFRVPAKSAPENRAARRSSDMSRIPLPDGVPIAGIAGDQQAALFGQAAFHA